MNKTFTTASITFALYRNKTSWINRVWDCTLAALLRWNMEGSSAAFPAAHLVVLMSSANALATSFTALISTTWRRWKITHAHTSVKTCDWLTVNFCHWLASHLFSSLSPCLPHRHVLGFLIKGYLLSVYTKWSMALEVYSFCFEEWGNFIYTYDNIIIINIII